MYTTYEETKSSVGSLLRQVYTIMTMEDSWKRSANIMKIVQKLYLKITMISIVQQDSSTSINTPMYTAQVLSGQTMVCYTNPYDYNSQRKLKYDEAYIQVDNAYVSIFRWWRI